jgi:type IV pilus assembly protein PilM
MRITRHTTGIGLDIGQTTVKALRLDRRGKGIVLSGHALLDIKEEGLLDESELNASIAPWLQEKINCQKQPLCVSLPQYLATTQISDFTAGVKADELAKMVRYETLHLAGLSEATFIYDYQPMPAVFGRNNPVLIGICRETTVDEFAERYAGMGLRLDDMAMSGMAAVNALFHLRPEEASAQAPRLVIDIGHENSTVVVLAGGEVLYVGSLMFGSLRFTQVLAHALGCTEAEADVRKKSLTLDDVNDEQSLLLAMRQLEAELRTAIDHWRGGEHSELKDALIERIWLCGGGAQLPGLARHLARTYGCEVALFGPEINGQIAPTYAVAYGLALQGLGEVRFHLSLIPKLLRWQKERILRFPYLVAAAALFFLLVYGVMASFHVHWSQGQRRLEEQLRELKQCSSVVPKLDAVQDQIASYQKMLLPIVEYGGRPHRFVESMEKLSEAFPDGVWSVYLADEFSHRANAAVKDDKGKGGPSLGPPAAAAMAGSGAMFGGATPAADGKANAGPSFTNVSTMPLLTYMVLGGFTPIVENKRFEAVLAIQNNLNDPKAVGTSGTDGKAPENYFTGVDWLDESSEWTGRELEVIEPWAKFLQGFQVNTNPKRPALDEYTQFFLKLPFAKKPITLPEPPPPKAKGSKKG